MLNLTAVTSDFQPFSLPHPARWLRRCAAVLLLAHVATAVAQDPGADARPKAAAAVAPSNIAIDVDGDGQVDALTDGLLLLRYMFGLRGTSLVTGAVGAGAARTTSGQIETYLGGLLQPVPPSALSPTAPASATAGVEFTVQVSARDYLQNPAQSYTGTVSFTSNDPAATLPANYAYVAGDAGTHAFPVTLRTAGTRTVTASAAGMTSGTTANIAVGPAPAATLSVAGLPAQPSAGIAYSLTVSARDGFGNLATGYLGTVHFTSTDPSATLPADYTYKAADAGVASFQVTLRSVGTRSVTATDTVTPAITGAQTVTVIPGPAATLAVTSFPSPRTSGTAGTFIVSARDLFGNFTTNYFGTVHFTSSDPTATLPANYTFTFGDGGVKAFQATLRTLGTQSITATDMGNASITGTQSNILIN